MIVVFVLSLHYVRPLGRNAIRKMCPFSVSSFLNQQLHACILSCTDLFIGMMWLVYVTLILVIISNLVLRVTPENTLVDPTLVTYFLFFCLLGWYVTNKLLMMRLNPHGVFFTLHPSEHKVITLNLFAYATIPHKNNRTCPVLFMLAWWLAITLSFRMALHVLDLTVQSRCSFSLGNFIQEYGLELELLFYYVLISVCISYNCFNPASQIVNWRNYLKFPEEAILSPEVKDLISRLLCNVEHRLGTKGAQEIKVCILKMFFSCHFI